jgi:hypothetical protein
MTGSLTTSEWLLQDWHRQFFLIASPIANCEKLHVSLALEDAVVWTVTVK